MARNKQAQIMFMISFLIFTSLLRPVVLQDVTKDCANENGVTCGKCLKYTVSNNNGTTKITCSQCPSGLNSVNDPEINGSNVDFTKSCAMPGWLIAVIVLSCLAFVGIYVVIVCCCCKYKGGPTGKHISNKG